METVADFIKRLERDEKPTLAEVLAEEEPRRARVRMTGALEALRIARRFCPWRIGKIYPLVRK